MNNGYISVPPERIRNISIIAHIDHGKSTLADRLLEVTGTVSSRDMKDQFMDSNDIERDRGITIKLNAARMNYINPVDGLNYVIHLIDTPGHVDFTFEVSRSLEACEGALLVVDASQGVEAQTLANVYLALDANLEMIPVLNKIDLPGAEPDRVVREIEEVVGLDCTNAVMASAKAGIGIDEILQGVINYIPPPRANSHLPLRALIFDSYYDPYRGVVVYFRVVDGEIHKGDKIKFMVTKKEFYAEEIGVMTTEQQPVHVLRSGEIGYIIAGIKTVDDARVGDTITTSAKGADEALPGYQEAKPMLFAGLFPVESDQYNHLKDSLEKLKLNDAALQFEVENSAAMGFGFRCGFLGLLHMDVVQERLEREYDLDIITTAPSVVYSVMPTKGEEFFLDNPADLPEATKREFISEPYCKLEIITPEEYVGTLMELAQGRRGEYVDMKYLVQGRTTLVYDLPLAELVNDFFDHLKSRTKGYASMEYSFIGYRKNDLVRLDVAINGEPVDALSSIVHQEKSYAVGKALVKKLKEIVPRAQFKIPIQAKIGAKVVASQQISALKKDVTAKCYGGDISRKKKLIQKQAAGKKRMKAVGKVNVPQEAFKAMLSINDS
ncbi:Translation elongation factor 4, Rhodoplastic [Chondrus crispus]|uniref:Translation factor GUF1 homolog, mitochondrial n=1 Tax=Chondrus crispus TaxID=2769 RepID=R7QR63_CHOCR|nr:Translation elongation factor 4, Rhodoplastic [Chondrus crispus]CDF39870.1 Translation elongation factor 4, Rhodoplastic [Chondrus crispus]|eukprot:XP_005710164.1 Translation elongation factor 4, Rhodoplastic [Chondrus crispus]